MGEPFGVRGRVLGDDGQPRGGVRVFADQRSVVTDGEGRFAFDDLTSTVLWAWDGDLSVPYVHVRTESEIDLRMRPGAMVIVRVLADGVPLAGAIVALTRVLRTTTDEHGIATLRGVPARPLQHPYDGRVAAEGKATHPLLLPVSDLAPVIERTIELVPGAEVSGRVVGPSGQPVRARVEITGATEEASGEAIPNDDGLWGLALPAGRYQIAVATQRWRTPQPLVIECDGITALRDLVVAVVSPDANTHGRIAGVVVDEQGRPAAGAEIQLWRVPRQHSMFEWFGRTDEAGRFESAEVGTVDGELDAVVSWPGWRLWDEPPPQRVRVGDHDLKLVVPIGATLVGRVLQDGAPVRYFGHGVLSRRRREIDTPITDPIGVRCDDGRFAIPHVPAGERRVAVLAPGTRLAITEEVTIAGNETIDLGDVALERGARVTGFVRDRSGAPVANARVIVGHHRQMANVWGPLESAFMGHYATTTDATGAYVLDGIDAVRPTFGPLGGIIQAEHPVAGLSVISEVPVTDATLDFVLLGRGRITGTVHNVPGYLVAIRAGEPAHARLVMERKGRFELEVPPGDYVIRRHDEESPSARVTVVDGQTVSATLVMDG